MFEYVVGYCGKAHANPGGMQKIHNTPTRLRWMVVVVVVVAMCGSVARNRLGRRGNVENEDATEL